MKALTPLLLSAFSFSRLPACGAVVDPGASDAASDDAIVADLDAALDADAPPPDAPEPDAPPPPELPFIVDSPAAATGPNALSAVTLATGDAAIPDLVASTASAPRFEIVQQRLITTTADPVVVSIVVTPPAGTFARALATDTLPIGEHAVAQRTLCFDGVNFTAADPCVFTPPAHAVTTASGAITQARWQVRLLDEDRTPVACTAATPLAIECVLPGRAGAAYDVVVAADRFADLWNGTAIDDHVLDAKRFTGAVGNLEFWCTAPAYVGVNEYCDAHRVYTRFTAIDSAALAVQPIEITIAASGAAESFASPALTWNAGNDDLPGAIY